MYINKAALESVVTDIKAGTFLTPTLKLFKAFAANPTPAPGDFTECDYSGYAGVTSVTLSGPAVYPDGQVGFLFSHLFVGGAATPQVGNSVAGYFLLDSTGADVLLWETFDEAQPMSDVTTFLPVTGELKINPALPIGNSDVG